MVGNFINNLVNREFLRKLSCSKDLLKRFLSSFLFIPMIALVWFLNDVGFEIFCWVIFSMIVKELFDSEIKGNLFWRISALLFCFFGIYSFIFVHSMFGKVGNIFLICVASLTDIGAFFFGKWLKGPKLCPKISPNKTWAGFVGGFLFCNAAFLIFPMPEFVHSVWLLQILILSAVIGDLLESSLKRKLEIKDLGNMFPGHGGVSDRLDSLLFVSMIFAAFCVCL